MIVTKQKSNTRDKPEVTAAPDRMSTVARQLQTEKKSPTEKFLQTELSSKESPQTEPSSKESIPRQSRRQRKVSPDRAVVQGK